MTPYLETLTRSRVAQQQLVELLRAAATLLSDDPPTVSETTRQDICGELYRAASALCEHTEIGAGNLCESCHARVFRSERRLDT